jgi:transcription elongation GreA/GreB family factor
LKQLSDQVRSARILTTDDVSTEEVGVGCVVDVVDGHGQMKQYTLLGPWEADPEAGVLSSQSRLAKSLCGQKKGSKFSYQGDEYVVEGFRNYFET